MNVNREEGTVNSWRVGFKGSQYTRPQEMDPRDAYAAMESREEYHLGARWFREGDELYSYWCMVDFDHKDPTRAMADCYRFVRDELTSKALLLGDDFVVCVSGRKGAKVFLRWLTSPADSNAQVWHDYLDSLLPRYPTLDPQTAYHATHRAPWSVHPKAPTRRQATLEDSSLLVRDPAFADKLPLGSKPSELVDYLPRFEEETPHRFLRWWGLASLPYLDKQAKKDTRRLSYRWRGLDLGALLSDAGIPFQSRTATSGRPYLRLARCPCCNARSKAAIILRSGYLRCFRGGCQAADGLALREWANLLGIEVPSSASRVPSDPAHGNALRPRKRAGDDSVSPLAARTAILDAVTSVLQGREESPVLLCATPGLGKTHITLECAVTHLADAYRDGEKKRIVIACPTRELAREAYDRSMAWNLPPVLERALLEGRNRDNCEFPNHVAAIGARGWSPGEAWCSGCPYREGCDYYMRLRRGLRAALIFTSYEQAIATLESGEMKADVVVFDEDPLRAFSASFSLDLAELSVVQGAAFDGDLRLAARLLSRTVDLSLASLMPDERLQLRGAELQRQIKRAARDLKLDAKTTLRSGSVAADLLQPQPAAMTGWTAKQIACYPSRAVGVVLAEALRDSGRNDEGAEFVGTLSLSVGGDGRAMWGAAERRRPTKNYPDLVLDAYGDPDIYEAVLGSPVKEVRARADLGRSSFENVPVNTSRRSLRDESSPAWRSLRQVVKTAKRRGEVLVCTYLSCVDKVARELDVKCYHFGRGRGLDAYREVPTVILFGVPEPPPSAILARACLVWQDDPTPLDPRRSSVNRRLYRDGRVQAVLDSMREAEAAQCAHRVRPVLAPRVVVTIGMVDFPTLPAPTRWTAQQHEETGQDELDAFVTGWWAERGWFSSAVLTWDAGEYAGARPHHRKITALYRRIWGNDRGKSLSPHPAAAAFRVWGDRDAARAWLRALGRAKGVAGWEDL